MPKRTTLVWFRDDLRLADHPALRAAAHRGAVVPLYVHAPHELEPWAPGAASRWWLHHSLGRLDEQLRAIGSRLVIRAGDSLAELTEVAARLGADAVYWSRSFEPQARRRDEDVAAGLIARGLEVRTFNASLLVEPERVGNAAGRPFQVFTPFWNTLRPLVAAELIAAPRQLPARSDPGGLRVDELELLPKQDWAAGLAACWQPGEPAAHARLAEFLGRLPAYASAREIPGIPGTSQLSPWLHFGEISPAWVWQAAAARFEASTADDQARASAETFMRELAWREFANHLLWHFPQTPEHPLRSQFERLAWRSDGAGFRAWSHGRTGYPLVDAGMRELWHTGWMHNRVRMVVASFLVKHLLIPWQEGAKWFWDTLVDADLANNTLGWQWAAGCGADAAPYFRVFNPVLQGQKFDPAGDYVRRYVPELAALPDKWLHQPWKAPPAVLAAVGARLGSTYPAPIVDHAFARQRFLAAAADLKRE